MKKGFTLMELLVVIAILAVVGVSSTIAFGNIDGETKNVDIENRYKEIQRGAEMYLDLNDEWLNQFASKETKEIFIRLSELANNNYIDADVVDEIDDDALLSYSARVYAVDDVNIDDSYMDTCIIDYGHTTTLENGTVVPKCIANSEGRACGCCDYPIDGTYNKKCERAN